MPKSQELLRFLRRAGYRKQRQTGSHMILKHPTRPMLIVPFHSGDLPRGLFLRILRDVGFSEKDYFEGK